MKSACFCCCTLLFFLCSSPTWANRHLAPLSESQEKARPVPGLNNQIEVHPTTGQLFMKGAAVNLDFPMIVVRHGETDGNRRFMFQGHVDEAENQLNKTGKKQARAAAKKLFRELQKTLGRKLLMEMARSGRLPVLTSPLGRAKETAEYFLEYFKQQTGILLREEIEPDLIEVNFGACDGYSLEQIHDEELIALIDRYRSTQDATISWKAGESFLAMTLRAKKLLETMNQNYAGKVVVAFTHGTFMSALRTAVGDRALLKENGMVAFRDKVLPHGTVHWLGGGETLQAFRMKSLERSS